MAKKEKNDKGQEAFRQALLKMARYRLRMLLKELYNPDEVRDAEAEGDDKMVDMIMHKYDKGEIDLPGMEKVIRSSSPKNDTDKEPKRKAKRSEHSDPYSSAFGDDDDSSDTEDSSNDDDDGANSEDNSNDDDDSSDDEDSIEIDEVEKPRKAARGKRREEVSESSAIEEKLDKVMNLLISNAEMTIELNEKLTTFISESIDFEEIVKLSLFRIWKTGSAEPMKPAFKEILEKSKEISDQRKGTPSDESD